MSDKWVTSIQILPNGRHRKIRVPSGISEPIDAKDLLCDSDNHIDMSKIDGTFSDIWPQVMIVYSDDIKRISVDSKSTLYELTKVSNVKKIWPIKEVKVY